MKKIITLLTLATLTAGNVSANHMDSNLNLRLFNYQPIKVQIDNQQDYSFSPTSTVYLNDIRPGRHFLSVWTERFGRRSLPLLAYQGTIDIPAASSISAIVTRNFNLRLVDVEPLCNNEEPYGNHETQFHNQYDTYNQQGNYNSSPVVYPNGYNPQNQQGHCTPMAMSPADFNALKACIATKSFDSTRLMVAKEALRNNAVNACQVAELMNLMTFESSRLEFAEFAYPYTIDQDRFYTVYNSFTFESSIRELSDYIGHHS